MYFLFISTLHKHDSKNKKRSSLLESVLPTHNACYWTTITNNNGKLLAAGSSSRPKFNRTSTFLMLLSFSKKKKKKSGGTNFQDEVAWRATNLRGLLLVMAEHISRRPVTWSVGRRSLLSQIRKKLVNHELRTTKILQVYKLHVSFSITAVSSNEDHTKKY